MFAVSTQDNIINLQMEGNTLKIFFNLQIVQYSGCRTFNNSTGCSMQFSSLSFLA